MGLFIIICCLILFFIYYLNFGSLNEVLDYSLLVHILPISNYGIKTFNDPINSSRARRDLIREENNGKVGVYCWVNTVNGKFYIGSGINLYKRLSDYFQSGYYLARPNVYILRAISKYGINNFSLTILEYTSSEDLISCEQKWIDLLKPEYNLCPIAGNSKGYKHSEENVEKIRNAAIGRKHTEEVKQTMCESRKGVNNPFYGKKHTKKSLTLLKSAAANRIKPPVPGIEVEITDLETNLTITYESIRKAANAINSDIKSIVRREKSQLEKGINTPYRNRYMIVIKRS